VNSEKRKKTIEAENYYHKAIRIMKPLLDDRHRYDHRDVINSLLVTGSCLENLKEFEKAEDLYQTLLEEYPFSRYVGEGHVKIARINKSRGMRVWRNGLTILKKGDDTDGRNKGIEGLESIQQSLNRYQSAIEQDPYSIWSEYAREDLKRVSEVLVRAKMEWISLPGDSKILKRIEHLMQKLSEIQNL
jgi:tetratricopeptide (TPR) repeat protein